MDSFSQRYFLLCHQEIDEQIGRDHAHHHCVLARPQVAGGDRELAFLLALDLVLIIEVAPVDSEQIRHAGDSLEVTQRFPSSEDVWGWFPMSPWADIVDEHGRAAVSGDGSGLNEVTLLGLYPAHLDWLTRHHRDVPESDTWRVPLLPFVIDESPDEKHIVARTDVPSAHDTAARERLVWNGVKWVGGRAWASTEDGEVSADCCSNPVAIFGARNLYLAIAGIGPNEQIPSVDYVRVRDGID